MKWGLILIGLLTLSVPVWAYTNSSSPESVCMQNLSDVQDVAFSAQLQDVAVCTIDNSLHGGNLFVVITAGIIAGFLILFLMVGVGLLSLVRRH